MRATSIGGAALAGGGRPGAAPAAADDPPRGSMAARGLSTEGHVVDPLVCLDCCRTRPDQVRDAIERDRRAAAEPAAVVQDRKER